MKFDVCIYGATGFAGRGVALCFADSMAKNYLNNNTNELRTWCIAGRDESKLESVFLEICYEMTKSNCPNSIFPEKMTASVENKKELNDVVRRCSTLINCVGPLSVYGIYVVEACIFNGTHYVDISGDSEFVETVMLDCNDSAKNKQVLVIPSCGFYSVINDLGFYKTCQRFSEMDVDARCMSVESFITTVPGPWGVLGHISTFEGDVKEMGNVKQRLKTREKLRMRHIRKVGDFELPKELSSKPKYNFWDHRVNARCFKISDEKTSVVRNTQFLCRSWYPENTNYFPDYYAYSTVSSIKSGCRALLIKSLMKIGRWNWGRKIMLQFPSFFTLEITDRSNQFTMDFYAKGCTKKGKSLISTHTRLTSEEIGDIATCKIVVQCVLTLLKENNILGNNRTIPRGGVYTPAAAFRNTRIFNRLEDIGITFKKVREEIHV
jgi:short subunit dehydrogenase-like uncharacterized protein